VAALVTAAIVILVLVAFGIALVQDSSSDDASVSAVNGSSVSPQPLVPAPPAAPIGVEASAKPFAVVLRWSPDGSAGPIEGYTIYRNGREIGTVTGDGAGRFVDDETLPRLTYVYAVAAFGEDELASEPTEIRVTTPTGPVAAARVEGTFAVKIDERSTFGYATSGGDASGGWTFTPRCDEGPCDVKVDRILRKASTVMLERRSARYRATGRAELGVKCSGTRIASRYDIQMRVVDAKTVEGEWLAVRIEGTFVHREAAQRGCVAGGAELAFTGKLVDL
jgi:hypothetical protein